MGKLARIIEEKIGIRWEGSHGVVQILGHEDVASILNSIQSAKIEDGRDRRMAEVLLSKILMDSNAWAVRTINKELEKIDIIAKKNMEVWEEELSPNPWAKYYYSTASPLDLVRWLKEVNRKEEARNIEKVIETAARKYAEEMGIRLLTLPIKRDDELGIGLRWIKKVGEEFLRYVDGNEPETEEGMLIHSVLDYWSGKKSREELRKIVDTTFKKWEKEKSKWSLRKDLIRILSALAPEIGGAMQ